MAVGHIAGGQKAQSARGDEAEPCSVGFDEGARIEGPDGGESTQDEGIDAVDPASDPVTGMELEGRVDQGREEHGEIPRNQEGQGGEVVAIEEAHQEDHGGHTGGGGEDVSEAGGFFASCGQGDGAQEGPDGHDGHEEPIPGGGLAEGLLGIEGNHDVVVHGEGTEECQEKDGVLEGIPSADVAETLKDAGIDPLEVLGFGSRGEGCHGGGDHEESDQDGNVAGGVDVETGSKSDPADEEPPDGGS